MMFEYQDEQVERLAESDRLATDDSSFLGILDELDALVYIADIETHKLLYVNPRVAALFGPFTGGTCWEYLHTGQEAQCAFCTNDRLLDDDGNPRGAYQWEFRNPRVDRWYHIIDRAVRWKSGRLIRVEVAFDITERKRSEELAVQQAWKDGLTGLPNRAGIQEVLNKVHASARRRDEAYAVLLMDLDRFKLINDHYGHSTGDRVLRDAAAAVRGSLRNSDWVGRWGGEEFIGILPQTEAAGAAEIAERIRKRVENTPMAAAGNAHNITVSIGFACYPANGEQIDGLLAVADATLYEAKRAGRNLALGPSGKATGVLTIAAQLAKAISEKRIRPAYQPIVDLASRTVVAEESLARIVSQDGGVLQEAKQFIEAANHLQLVHRIDHSLILQTLGHCTRNVLDGSRVLHFINVSADLLRHPELIDDIMQKVQQACCDCAGLVGEDKPLVLEITERECLGGTQAAKEVLAPLLEFGVRIAIDDFGSGYSSFQYLADLPVSFVKIEQTLITRLKQESSVRRIVKGISDIAQDLGQITIAEFVGDRETALILQDLGIDWGQGHFFGAPRLPVGA